MLSKISSAQLSEWIAYSKLEPFGFQADMYGHAITSSVVANVNRRKGKPAFSPDDFIPKDKEIKTAKSFIENLKAMFKPKGK